MLRPTFNFLQSYRLFYPPIPGRIPPRTPPKMFRMDSIKSAIRAPFAPKLSTDECADLPSHIAHTRASIFELERRIHVARTNLLTISRCMKGMVPPSSTTSKIYSGTFGVFDLPRAIADLEESCSQITLDQQDLLRQQEVKRSTSFPAQLIDRPVVIPDSERIISPPRSLNCAYIAALRMSAEGSYHLLKVKKQELKIEMDKLEADVKHWGDIYAHMTSSKTDSQEQAQTTQRSPRLLRSPASRHSRTRKREAISSSKIGRAGSGICKSTRMRFLSRGRPFRSKRLFQGLCRGQTRLRLRSLEMMGRIQHFKIHHRRSASLRMPFPPSLAKKTVMRARDWGG
ncbi:hypothetical protein DL98DRAFT_210096 [Cadophora sp. DSE1049]|nr:hypothetical protein DL98DRAFT_210096 [Cadophora sp. DSE1049]